MRIFVCNAGSSSLKFSLFEADGEKLLIEGGIDWGKRPARLTLRPPGEASHVSESAPTGHGDAVACILDALRSGPSPLLTSASSVQAVGHRVVHGGERYSAAALITPTVLQAIEDLSELAPLHHPASLAVIDALDRALPGVPQVAAFDTAFHATLPEAARTYAVPRQWTQDWHIRRYGFHGLSHGYCAARAAQMLGRTDRRLVIAHLGNGASMSAVRDGICIDTSMGFTPMEGLMMGTRSGSVDPGALIHLMQNKGMDANALHHALNHESGLLGVSGISSDMRQVQAAAEHHADARLAIEVYVHRVRQTVGAMAATLGGVDALIFTAGVGENAPDIRRRVCEQLDFLGLRLDGEANAACRPDADIARHDSAARILVIATREDVTILRETRRLLSSKNPSASEEPRWR